VGQVGVGSCGLLRLVVAYSFESLSDGVGLTAGTAAGAPLLVAVLEGGQDLGPKAADGEVF
jgi:hypothetical protein